VIRPRNQLWRIDPTTAKVLARIDVGSVPVGSAVGLGAVWVANTFDQSVSKIDPRTNKVDKTINIGHSQPTWFTIADDAVWVQNEDATVSRIDPATDKVVATYDVPLGQFPDPATVDGSTWVADSTTGKVSRMDPASGHIDQTLQLRQGVTVCVEAMDDVWALNFGGTEVYRIHPQA
jgi:YVTN family beta-propeller protein